MSSIDLAILGMVLEKPQSAYDIQKDVEYHHFSKWTRISTPSVYRKVLELKEKGYLSSDTVKGSRHADKAVYAITDTGRAYFEQLMARYADQAVSFLFDFNVVIANLGKLEQKKALPLLAQLRGNIAESAWANHLNAAAYPDLPLFGRTIFEQQERLYGALLEWLDTFERQFNEYESRGGQEQPDDPV